MKAIGVTGPIPEEEIGTTLMHEHLLFDFRHSWDPPESASRRRVAEQPVEMKRLGVLQHDPFLIRDNLFHGNVRRASEELRAFVEVGGQTVVEASTTNGGRDPVGLRRISRRTGLNIVMGAGYYIDSSLDESFRQRPLEDVTDELIGDVRNGAAGTGVRAGFIGEIGTSSPVTEAEKKSLRAAARAQSETGAPLMIHLDGWAREAHPVLDLVEEEGADTKRTVLCHMNPSWNDQTYQQELASRGAYLSYDMMGMTYFYPPDKPCPTDTQALQGVRDLIEAGFTDRVLLSQDVFLKSMLKAFGGLGYDHVFTSLLPYYEAADITSEQRRVIFEQNPRTLLAYRE